MQSRLHEIAAPKDFLDCYATPSDHSPRAAAQIIVDYPDWTEVLMKLRNALVSPFGLVTESAEGSNAIGYFPIESESPDELILGLNDKHLDFRMSILSENREIFLSTWVRTHNMGGRLYLGMVMPFHVLIIRNALERLSESHPAS